MSYLLDTCIVSKLRKKDNMEADRIREWVSKYDSSTFFLSALTIGELQFGIAKLNESEKIKNALQSWLFGHLVPSFEDKILPIDLSVSLLWGLMTAQAARKGISLPVADALIAATAIKNDLIVVTLNTRHFEATGARIFKPL